MKQKCDSAQVILQVDMLAQVLNSSSKEENMLYKMYIVHTCNAIMMINKRLQTKHFFVLGRLMSGCVWGSYKVFMLLGRQAGEPIQDLEFGTNCQ